MTQPSVGEVKAGLSSPSDKANRRGGRGCASPNLQGADAPTGARAQGADTNAGSGLELLAYWQAGTEYQVGRCRARWGV